MDAEYHKCKIISGASSGLQYIAKRSMMAFRATTSRSLSFRKDPKWPLYAGGSASIDLTVFLKSPEAEHDNKYVSLKKVGQKLPTWEQNSEIFMVLFAFILR